MTVAGVALALVGMVVGLTSPIAHNGQWLLGFMIAILGVAMCAVHTFNTKEKNK